MNGDPRAESPGPVVRAYAIARGRARPVAGTFDLLAHVAANPDGVRPASELQPEQRVILATLAAGPVTVAELASRLDLALGVVRVLLGDLLAEGLIRVPERGAADHLPDDTLLKAVIDGLRTL